MHSVMIPWEAIVTLGGLKADDPPLVYYEEVFDSLVSWMALDDIEVWDLYENLPVVSLPASNAALLQVLARACGMVGSGQEVVGALWRYNRYDGAWELDIGDGVERQFVNERFDNDGLLAYHIPTLGKNGLDSHNVALAKTVVWTARIWRLTRLYFSDDLTIENFPRFKFEGEKHGWRIYINGYKRAEWSREDLPNLEKDITLEDAMDAIEKKLNLPLWKILERE